MAKEMDLVAKVGSWAFIFGVVVALVVGIFGGKGDLSVATTVLIILGLIVGLLNVTGKETTPFLLASVSLVIVSSMGGNVFPAYGFFFAGRESPLEVLLHRPDGFVQEWCCALCRACGEPHAAMFVADLAA